MKLTLIITFLLTLSTISKVLGQITAGEIPATSTVIDPNVSLTAVSWFEADSLSFDLDCDSQPDVTAHIYKGTLDVQSIISFKSLNPTLEFCYDSATTLQPHYYNFGDSLNCSAGFGWYSGIEIILGNYSMISEATPISQSNRYIAYRLSGQIGWMKVSYDLTNYYLTSSPITFDVDEVLTPCTPSTISGDFDVHQITISPNPSIDGLCKFTYDKPIVRLELYSITGAFVLREDSPASEFMLPTTPGIYLVHLIDESGRVFQQKVIRR